MPIVQRGLLNQGLYDPTEAAHVLRIHPDTLLGWTAVHRGRPALLAPSFESFFSFHDLVSLMVIAEMAHRGVPQAEIRRGIEHLSAELGTARPLAHRKLATVGRAFFADLGEWVDAGRGGQGAFPDVIRPLLRPIEYGADEMASVWRPLQRVWLNPRVQVGAPCIDRTRVPTRLIASLLQKGEDAGDIADDYEIDIEDVRAAESFEAGIRAAA
jgi:uncharacterized protein (DUF433 family)